MFVYIYIYILNVGDNVLTAVSVSRECGLVEQYAEIYIPRFIQGSSTEPNSVLSWESVVNEGQKLNPNTLLVNSILFCFVLCYFVL